MKIIRKSSGKAKLKLTKREWQEMGRKAGWGNYDMPSNSQMEAEEAEGRVKDAWKESISSEINSDIEKTYEDLDDIYDADGFLRYLNSANATQFAKFLLKNVKQKQQRSELTGETFNASDYVNSLINAIEKMEEKFRNESEEEFVSPDHGTYEEFVNFYNEEEHRRKNPYDYYGVHPSQFH